MELGIFVFGLVWVLGLAIFGYWAISNLWKALKPRKYRHISRKPRREVLH